MCGWRWWTFRGNAGGMWTKRADCGGGGDDDDDDDDDDDGEEEPQLDSNFLDRLCLCVVVSVAS